MIHYFNPGNETAILNTSKFYQPVANQVKMQKELAFLPAWYASADDFVFVNENLPEDFNVILLQLKQMAYPLTKSVLTNKKEFFEGKEISLWGLAPNSIYSFNQINEKYQLHWRIPEWKKEYKGLSGRYTAHKVLTQLISILPEIEKDLLPEYFTDISTLEIYLVKKEKQQLLKSPHSSSGRGLLWLPPTKLAKSERQIIGGMIKKQFSVSLENVLDKLLDFSMLFVIKDNKSIDFLGYSVFHTNSKGAYEKSFLASQQKLKNCITSLIDKDLLEKTKNTLLNVLKKEYAPHYVGNIGVDMLIYKSGNEYKLNPCVEINMRKSMGYLALQLQKNYLHPQSEGFFHLEYNTSGEETFQKHIKWQNQYPLTIEKNRIQSGYLSLCPLTRDTNYHSYIKVKS